RDADGWHLAQDYGPDNRYTYAPGAADVGDHIVQVWARTCGSTAAYDAWAGATPFRVALAPLTAASLTVDTAFPVPTGTQATWTLVADGGVPPLQYQFWVSGDGAGWVMAQDYGPSKTTSWTPPASGRYEVMGLVRSAGSATAYDVFTTSGPFDVKAGGP